MNKFLSNKIIKPMNMIPPQIPSNYTNVIIIATISIISILISFLLLIFYLISRLNNKKIYETWKQNQEKKYYLSFKNISYSISNLWTEQKILKQISGEIPQGKLVAIMGSSGSGKTSLLDILAQRNKTGDIQGEIFLNDEKISQLSFKRISGYVLQEDILMETLTVYECIKFSAECRLPTNMSESEKKKRIENAIQDLHLEHIRDSKIGGYLIGRGISGGEKRRVSIAMELVASPMILFLDEPTTGLDAYNALTIIKILSEISKAGKTIIFSIHQPRSSIFTLFDELILLSKGELAYFGPSSNVLEHFQKLGYYLPSNHSIPDFLIDLVEKLSKKNEKFVKNEEIEFEKFKDVNENYEYETSFFEQFYQLSKRNLKNFILNPFLFPGHVFISLLLSGLLSWVYFNMKNDFLGLQNRIGYYTFLTITLSLASMTSLEIFILEKEIFIRERSNGYYRTSAYFLSKILFDIIPLRLIPPIIIGSITYWSIGLKNNIYDFLFFLSLLILFSLISGAICLAIGSFFSSLSLSNLITITLVLFGVLYGGILVNNKNAHWIKYLSIFQYTIECLFSLEVIDTQWLFNPPGLEFPVIVSGDMILEYFGFSFSNFGRNLIILSGVSFTTIIISFVLLYLFSKEKR